MCKPYEGFSAVCDPPLAKLWACIQQHGASQCVAQTGAAPCATEQALAAACVQNCTLTDKCQCAPGGTVCVGKSVVSCAANGVLSKTLLNCAQYGSSCADGACVGLKTCPKPYASSCAGNKAIYCDASGVVTLKEDCETAPNQKCVAGQCLEICQPNTVFCSKKNYNAGALWNCSSSGVVDGVAKVCAGPTAGCLFEGCEAGETACSTKPSPDGTPCDDNDSCTIKDVCTAAKCIGKPAEDCVDTIPCTENGCDSAAGGCTKWLHHGLCDDGNACTADICTKSTGCWNGMTPDNCVLGTLVGPSCWTAQAYQFALKAAEIHEQCNWTANVAMPASIHSAADTAAAIARLASSQITKPTLIGLVNKPPSGAWLWSDGSKVDYTNWSGGQEPPGPGFVVINPKTGVWSKVAGSDAVQAVLCKTPDIADTCSDNDACTGGETCAQGKCQGAKQLCDDTNPCTLDQCDAATATVACTNKPVAAGATCDDGKTCSVGDACDGKGSCVASAAKPCDDGNPCTIDSCAEPAGCVYNYPAFPTKCGDGLACLEGACKPAGTCGDGVVNAGGEQCDDKNQQAGDGCSAQCTLEAATSCASLLDKFPALKDGDYLIDVDAGGPQPPVTLYCAMSKGGWTLVANLYDSAGDDFPNLAGDVTEGWQQTGSGQWGPVVQIAKVATDTGSAALGLQAVLALSVSGMKKLKICLVTQSGQEGECRSSPDSLTLGGTAEPSSPLAVWQGKPLVWTYGRLIGLPASGPSFAPADLVAGAGCVDAAAGKVNEFGQACTNLLKSGLCEAGGTTGMSGAWCGHCDGICLRPGATVDDEMATGGGAGKELVANPSSGSWGVRIYVRP
ncbi:MAG: hypothetical protein FJ100_10075 [Deltaproteobacteria bacterium]|nr:hypothetical protein [Deltaproteobacteria bacterium]